LNDIFLSLRFYALLITPSIPFIKLLIIYAFKHTKASEISQVYKPHRTYLIKKAFL